MATRRRSRYWPDPNAERRCTRAYTRQQQQLQQQQQVQQLVEVSLNDVRDSQTPRDVVSGGDDRQVEVQEPDASQSPTYHDDTEATCSASASRDIVIDDLHDRVADSSTSTGVPEVQASCSTRTAPEVNTASLDATAANELVDQSYIHLRVEADPEGDSSTSTDDPQEQVCCSNNVAPDVDNTSPDVDDLDHQSYVDNVIVTIVTPSPDPRADQTSAPQSDPAQQMNDHHNIANVDADRSLATHATELNLVGQPQVDDYNVIVPCDTSLGNLQLDAASEQDSGPLQSQPTGDRLSSPAEDPGMEVDAEAASTRSANVNTAHVQQRFNSRTQNGPITVTVDTDLTASTASKSNKR